MLPSCTSDTWSQKKVRFDPPPSLQKEGAEHARAIALRLQVHGQRHTCTRVRTLRPLSGGGVTSCAGPPLAGLRSGEQRCAALGGKLAGERHAACTTVTTPHARRMPREECPCQTTY